MRYPSTSFSARMILSEVLPAQSLPCILSCPYKHPLPERNSFAKVCNSLQVAKKPQQLRKCCRRYAWDRGCACGASCVGGARGGQTRGRNGAFMLRTHTHRSEPLCSLGVVAMPRHLCVRLTTRSPPHRLRLTPGRRAENTDSTVTCRNSTSVPQRDQLRCEHSMLPPVCLRALISISTLVAHHLHISAPL